MASSATITKFPYQRLTNEGGFVGFYDEEDGERLGNATSSRRRYGFKRVVLLRRRVRVRVPSLRRFLRRKARQVGFGISKVVKRLKESQAYFGDLFAGNYLFVQVNPTSLKCLENEQNVNNGLRLFC